MEPARTGREGAMADWWVYIIEKQLKYSVGITTDMPNRLRQHGQSAALYQEGPLSRTRAAGREKELKGWSRQKKESLIAQASENVSLP